MDIVVSGNSQLQLSIIGSDMPSALGLVLVQRLHRIFGAKAWNAISALDIFFPLHCIERTNPAGGGLLWMSRKRKYLFPLWEKMIISLLVKACLHKHYQNIWKVVRGSCVTSVWDFSVNGKATLFELWPHGVFSECGFLHVDSRNCWVSTGALEMVVVEQAQRYKIT